MTPDQANPGGCFLWKSVADWNAWATNRFFSSWNTGPRIAIDVGSGTVTGGGAAGAGAAPRPVESAPPRPPRPPPRPPNGCGTAKPVGTTIDGVPVMFVSDVFSCGV